VGDRLMAAAKTGNRPYSGRPKTSRSTAKTNRQAPGPGEASFDAPTAAERRHLDEEQSRPFKEAYAAGEKAGKEAARAGAKKGTGKGKPSSSKRPSSSRRRAPRSVRTAARQLQAPVRVQVTSGLRIMGVTLALVALYNILTTPGPEAFSGVLGGLSKALQWISAPAPIPKKG
jgi:hypothetical protein